MQVAEALILPLSTAEEGAERELSVFATVGSMLPFDRLVRAVDQWAAENPSVRTFIQIGDGTYQPQHAEWARMVTPAEFVARMEACTLLVAHAGIGSMVQALQARKQLLILPRQASLGEHTNDHQLQTVTRFRSTPGLAVADDIPALHAMMSALIETPLPVNDGLSAFGSSALTARVRQFLTA